MFKIVWNHIHKWTDTSEDEAYIGQSCRCGARRSIVVAHHTRSWQPTSHVIRDDQYQTPWDGKGCQPRVIIPPSATMLSYGE